MEHFILPAAELTFGLILLCAKEPRGFPLYLAILLLIWGDRDFRAALALWH